MFTVQQIRTSSNSLKRITCDSGKIVFSRLRDWHNTAVFSDISIKYVLKGTETYFDAAGARYKVESGQLLLGNFEPNTGECVVKSASCVDGICIYVKPALLAEVQATLCAEAGPGHTHVPAARLLYPHFFNSILHARHTPLQLQLEKCGAWFYDTASEIDENMLQELLLETAEKIVLLQAGLQQSLDRVAALRPKTGEEILKRLLLAKTFMDDTYLENPPLSEMAMQGGFSRYHFLRSFRKAFLQTPFEYIRDRRLAYARRMLQKKGTTIKEIAANCSFSGVASFSKAFKNKYGIAPSLAKRMIY